MSDAAKTIRDQLRAKPNRKTFRKTRASLLDLAIEIEVLRKVVADLTNDKCRMQRDDANG